MVEITGFGGIAVNVWLVWILPFIGSAIIAAAARAGLSSGRPDRRVPLLNRHHASRGMQAGASEA